MQREQNLRSPMDKQLRIIWACWVLFFWCDLKLHANTNIGVPEAPVGENASSNVRVQDHIVSKTAHQAEVDNKQTFALQIKCLNEANSAQGRHGRGGGPPKT